MKANQFIFLSTLFLGVFGLKEAKLAFHRHHRIQIAPESKSGPVQFAQNGDDNDDDPNTLSEYCKGGGNQDPACQAEKPVQSLQEEIDAVYAHMRQWLDNKNDAQGDEAEEEKEKKGKEDKKEAEEHEEKAPEEPPMSHTEELAEAGHDMEKKVDKIEHMKEELDEEGLLDDDLNKELERVTHAAEEMTETIEEVAESKGKKSWDDVTKDMENLDRRTQKSAGTIKRFNTGLHPHGDKWWRYNYEYAFVESSMLVVVVFIIAVLSRVQFWIAEKMGVGRAIEAIYDQAYEHSTMHKRWASYFVAQMSVIALCFFFEWMLTHLGAFDVLADLTKIEQKSGKLVPFHLPKTGKMYEEQAEDVVSQIMIAVVFYYIIMYQIVRSSEAKIENWIEQEQNCQAQGVHNLERSRNRNMVRTVSLVSLGGNEEYLKLKAHFVDKVDQHSDLHKVAATPRGNHLHDFQFWRYLALTVRTVCLEELLMVGTGTWSCVMGTCFCFSLLHMFLHLSYVRIMICVAIVMAFCLFAMYFQIRRAKSDIYDASDTKLTPLRFGMGKSGVIFNTFQYTLLFLCYGASRLVASPYMWDIYFWQTVGLSLLFVFLFLMFALVFCQIFPVFAAIMAIPPYVDPKDAIPIIDIIKEHEKMSDISPTSAMSSMKKKLVTK